MEEGSADRGEVVEWNGEEEQKKREKGMTRRQEQKYSTARHSTAQHGTARQSITLINVVKEPKQSEKR